jgi:hypothetical protein
MGHLTGIDAEATIRTEAAGHYRMRPIRATEYEVRIVPSASVNVDAVAKAKSDATVKSGEQVEVGDLVFE